MSDAIEPKTYGVLGALPLPLGLGLLRLSTEGRPPLEDAIARVHQALDGGVRVLDTADSYALDDKDFHYGERLAKRALDAWRGPAAEVRVITKVGFARPKGRWVPDAEPKRIRAKVDGSLKALGVDRLFLLLLHTNDPRVPFEETLGALADLRRAGKIEHLGLCNTTIAEVRQAERHFPIAAIQNELSVLDRASANEGLVALARALGVPLLAHRPLGGHAKVGALAKNRALEPLAKRLGVTKGEAALAALLDVGHPIVPLFGATRAESVASSLRAATLRLEPADREALAARVSFAPTPAAAAAIAPIAPPAATLRAGDGPSDAPEIVLVMGIQGAGKSSLVGRYVDAGYARLNRDELGGTMDDLAQRLDALLAAGARRVVLDNTYPTRASRWPFVRAAHVHGVPARCVHLATSSRDAHVNVVLRTLERHGRLLGPEDLKALAKTDPNLPPPSALARWSACFEPPHVDEGFGAVERVEFVRRPRAPRIARALLLDVDGTVRATKSGEPYPRSADDVTILPGRQAILRRLVDDGTRLFFVSNQSGVASEKVTAAAVEAAFARTIELLGVSIEDVAYCPHPAFPVGCFCRKPLPGLGVHLAWKHGFDPAEATVVGDLESDARFAEAIGAKYVSAGEFFGAGG